MDAYRLLLDKPEGQKLFENLGVEGDNIKM
jgi:hypothetical protein